MVGVPAQGERRRRPAVQIDIDPTMLGIRYPTEVNLHGESGWRPCGRCCRCWTQKTETTAGVDQIEGHVTGLVGD